MEDVPGLDAPVSVECWDLMFRPSSSGVGRPLLRGPDDWLQADRPVSRSHGVAEIRQHLESTGWETPDLALRARTGIMMLTANRIGGNCWGTAAMPAPSGRSPAILAVLPPDPAAATEICQAVRQEHGSDTVLILRPSRRRGARQSPRLDPAWRSVDPAVDCWRLLDRVHTVYTAGDEIGFLALLNGLRVRCFGPALYSGCGLTEDSPATPRLGRTRTIEEVFAAICLLGADYTNPFTGTPCTFEDAGAVLAHWRRVDHDNRAISACVGMSIWKQRRVGDLLRTAGRRPRFITGAAKAIAIARRDGGAVAVWASREPADLAAAAQRAGVPVYRVEDGFIRSVGLGANFTPAASIVFDRDGMYFDPSRPSTLDHVLNESRFEPAMLDRARRLRQLLVQRGITKYNVGGAPLPLGAPAGRRVILVPGQVENDRSVILAGAGIRGNGDLLRRVRMQNPDAFIVYKPHPDVEAGHRPGVVAAAELEALADRVVGDTAMAALIDTVDEIHTLTSLAGFEGLLRGKRVVAYGQPFYAGWGLTDDRTAIPHRIRHLTLDELVAGALIVYPRYLDPVTRLPCGPELVIERLSHAAHWRPGPLVRARRLQGRLWQRWRSGGGTAEPDWKSHVPVAGARR